MPLTLPVTLPVKLPEKVAVIVPAAKFPEPSRSTSLPAVFEAVAAVNSMMFRARIDYQSPRPK